MGAKYRDLVPALLLLTGLTLVLAGVTATRLGLITVEVKIGLGPRATRNTTGAVPAPQPTPRRVTAPEGPAPAAFGAPEPLSAAEPVEAPAPGKRPPKLMPTIATAEAAVGDDTPATPVEAAPSPPRRKPLASAAGKPARVAECATVTRPANVDPTGGEIAGTTGLPDQVNYFKHSKKTAPCRPVTRTVSSTR